MTWLALWRRFWRMLRLRFTNFHECPECGVPMVRRRVKDYWTGRRSRIWSCYEPDCMRSVLGGAGTNFTCIPLNPGRITRCRVANPHGLGVELSE